MTKGFLFLIAMVVIVLILKELVGGKGKEEKKKPLYQYKKKGFLITPAEREFFDVLIEVIGDRYYVFPQMHLSHFLDEKIKGQKWAAAFSHINQKSVDFVICDKAKIEPLLAIELDDKTHDEPVRIVRDNEVVPILENAGMRLLRIKNHGSFDKEEIKKLVLEKIV